MNNKGQAFKWEDLVEIWTSSAQTKQISIQISALLSELKEKTSTFEKDLIKSDLATLKTNWNQTKNKVSTFEMDSINKDLNMITRFLKRLFGGFRKGKH